MDALTACWIGGSLTVALAALAGCVWVVCTNRREPRNSLDGYGFAAFFMLGLCALVALIRGLERVSLGWSAGGIVAVNVLIQPFCLYLFAAGVYKLVMVSAGRVVYAWQRVPQEGMTAEEYRGLRLFCGLQGIVACLFSSWLAWTCLKPLM